MATIGEQLKAAREAKGVSEAEAGIETKILTRLIVSIEKDDFSTIAAPAYAKGFIRIYAEYLGIDPEPLIEEYTTLHSPRPVPHQNEHSQLHKSRHPVSRFSLNPLRDMVANLFQKKDAPEHEDEIPPESQDSPHSGHDIRMIAAAVAGLIVLIVLIVSITNCARQNAAEKPKSKAEQIKAARKLLDEPLPDLYLTEPEKIETSR